MFFDLLGVALKGAEGTDAAARRVAPCEGGPISEMSGGAQPSVENDDGGRRFRASTSPYDEGPWAKPGNSSGEIGLSRPAITMVGL